MSSEQTVRDSVKKSETDVSPPAGDQAVGLGLGLARSAAVANAEQATLAEHAVRRRDWAAASRHFTKAAAAIPPDPHGSVTAEELILRRQAHVASSMHKRMQHFGLERAFVIPEGSRQ